MPPIFNNRTLDNIYAYQIFNMIAGRWEDLEAFKLGIIDKNGKRLKRKGQLKTRDEKLADTPLKRLAINIKRLIWRLGGKSKIGSIAAAMFLMRESLENEYKCGSSFETATLEFLLGNDWDYTIQSDNTPIAPGVYKINESLVYLNNNEPLNEMYGIDIYEAEDIIFSKEDAIPIMNIDFDDEEEVATLAHKTMAQLVKKGELGDSAPSDIRQIEVTDSEIDTAASAFESIGQTHKRRLGFISNVLGISIDEDMIEDINLYQMVVEVMGTGAFLAKGIYDPTTKNKKKTIQKRGK